MRLYGQHGKYKIFHTNSAKDRHFYSQMGRFFCDKAIIKELEGPIYSDDGYHWLLVKDDMDIVGFASCRGAGKGVWWFADTWIHPDHRRNGLYRKLFILRQSLCLEMGAEILKGTAPLHSKKLFEENGYTVTSTRGPRWTWYEKKMEAK